MKCITITVETGDQAEQVLAVLQNAEEDGELDFAFGTEVRNADDRTAEMFPAGGAS